VRPLGQRATSLISKASFSSDEAVRRGPADSEPEMFHIGDLTQGSRLAARSSRVGLIAFPFRSTASSGPAWRGSALCRRRRRHRALGRSPRCPLPKPHDELTDRQHLLTYPPRTFTSKPPRPPTYQANRSTREPAARPAIWVSTRSITTVVRTGYGRGCCVGPLSPPAGTRGPAAAASLRPILNRHAVPLDRGRCHSATRRLR
jgi:hypothetical protein